MGQPGLRGETNVCRTIGRRRGPLNRAATPGNPESRSQAPRSYAAPCALPSGAIGPGSDPRPDLGTILPQPSSIHWGNVTTIVSVCILVGTELVGMSWAAGWALGGLFGLAPAIARSVEIVFGLLGFVALYFFMRAAIKVEPIKG